MEYKTQEEYLLALAEAIKYLNPKDATKVLQYYQTRITSSIEYGEKEADVIRKLPSVDQVAKETYESHGVNYLELRKIQLRRKKIFTNIINTLISILVLISFFVVMFLIIKSFGNMFALLGNIFTSSNLLDKLITSVAVISYIAVMLLLTIYIVDLFIIILSFFLGDIFKLKNEDLQRKIVNFTISGFIEEKTNHKKVQVLSIVSFLCLAIICMVGSYAIDGYVKHSLNDSPSNTSVINLDYNISNINIEGYNGNIYFKQSETNEFYLEHKYEFKKNLNVSTSNNTLNLELEMSKSFDLLDLFTEPTQYLIFYIPTTVSLNDVVISMDESTIDFSNVNFNNATIETESLSKVSFVGVTANKVSTKGYDVSCAIHSSSISEELYVESLKGQTLVQKDSVINALKANNGTGTIKLESSIINTLSIDNTSGTIDVTNLSGNTLTLNSKTSNNNFKDISYKTINATMKSSGSLSFTRTYAENIDITCNNSRLLFDYVKGIINVNADAGTLYLSGVGSNYPNLECDYNNIVCDTNITTSNKGKTSKTEIVDSTLVGATLSQEYGYFMFTNNFVSVATVNCSYCDTVDFKNLTGGICNLYLAKIETSLIIDADAKTNFKYIVKKTDAISFANLIRNEETTTLELETEVPHE